MTQRPGRILTLIGVILVLGFYAEALVHAPVTGQDLRNFYAAATLLQHGGNPYDAGPFLARQEALYHPIHAADRAALAGNPYVQGPPLAIALMPFVGAAPSTVYVYWAVTLGLCAAMALVTLARLWPTARSTRRAFLLLISPVTFLGILLGQPDAVLLLALVLALWTLERDHPWSSGLSGLLLTIGLIKPQLIAGPIVLLAVLAWRRGRLAPYTGGVLGGAALFLALSLLGASPTVVGGWAGGLVGFGRATVYNQVDISSLTTLYVGWAPHGLSLILSALALLGWIGLCTWAWRAAGAGRDERWWLGVGLVGWLLATPYAHPHDDILLLPAVWLLYIHNPTMQGMIGSISFSCSKANKYILRSLFSNSLHLAWWLMPMMSVLGLRPPGTRGLGIIPILLIALVYGAARPTFAMQPTPHPAVVTSSTSPK